MPNVEKCLRQEGPWAAIYLYREGPKGMLYCPYVIGIFDDESAAMAAVRAHCGERGVALDMMASEKLDRHYAYYASEGPSEGKMVALWHPLNRPHPAAHEGVK